MYFVFADDAKQDRPSRKRMGPLVAAGAILVMDDSAGDSIRSELIATERVPPQTWFSPEPVAAPT
jgi:hypothetical protein